jgi:hypothetical protein
MTGIDDDGGDPEPGPVFLEGTAETASEPEDEGLGKTEFPPLKKGLGEGEEFPPVVEDRPPLSGFPGKEGGPVFPRGEDPGAEQGVPAEFRLSPGPAQGLEGILNAEELPGGGAWGGACWG